MHKRDRVVCGPQLPGTTQADTATESGGYEESCEEEEDSTCPFDRRRFLAIPACEGGSKSSPCILFYRRQFPVYPEGAPTEAWDMLRLHLGQIVHQAAFDLNLPVYAVAAAVSAFHAVFPGHFTREELCGSPHLVSRCMAACLFLAGKTSETNLKLREAVNCIDFLQWKLQQQHRQNLAAARSLRQKHPDSSQDLQRKGAGSSSSGEHTPSACSNSGSCHQSKGEEPQKIIPQEQRGERGGSGSSAASDAIREEDQKKTDATEQATDAQKKVETEPFASGDTKDSVKQNNPGEEGLTQEEENKDGGDAATGNQSQKGGSTRPRACGIASFLRSSEYLKGYVPMGIREYWHVRQECLREEERLLQALGFSLPLPYLYDVLLEALVLMLPTHQEAHLTWAIANDIAAGPLLEQFSPPVLIAAAALCAKKLLAVAASFPSAHHMADETSTTSGTTGTTASTPLCTPAPIPSPASRLSVGRDVSDPASATDAAESEVIMAAPPGSADGSDKLKTSKFTCISSGSSSSGNSEMGVVSRLDPPLESRYDTVSQPPEDAAEQLSHTSGAASKPPANNVELTRRAPSATLTADAGSGQYGSSAASNSDFDEVAATSAEDGMIEVLERLDPLLCGSPEYWALCKGHERRGLERGGSRWARALPPAALGWTTYTPPKPAATHPPTGPTCPPPPPRVPEAANDKQDSPVENIRPRCASHNARPSQSRQPSADDVRDRSAAENEEEAERERLLKAEQEDQRQRRLIYVQIAEACARLMEIYSVLLKSQRTPSDRDLQHSDNLENGVQ